jgi:hypothetical protein
VKVAWLLLSSTDSSNRSGNSNLGGEKTKTLTTQHGSHHPPHLHDTVGKTKHQAKKAASMLLFFPLQVPDWHTSTPDTRVTPPKQVPKLHAYLHKGYQSRTPPQQIPESHTSTQQIPELHEHLHEGYKSHTPSEQIPKSHTFTTDTRVARTAPQQIQESHTSHNTWSIALPYPSCPYPCTFMPTLITRSDVSLDILSFPVSNSLMLSIDSIDTTDA